MGLAGSVHCIGMCGGILTVFARNSPLEAPVSLPGILVRQSVFHLGRISSYGLIGVLVALAGKGLLQFSAADQAYRLGLVTAAAFMLLAGLYVSGLKWSLIWLESLGQKIWQRWSPLAKNKISLQGNYRAYLAGILWGWLPCGMVYAAAGAAGFSGTVMSSAKFMIIFGLGTIPALMLASVSIHRFSQLSRNRTIYRLLGIVIICMALYLLWSAFRGPLVHQH